MSKLEDKLAASIKPARRQTAAVKAPRTKVAEKLPTAAKPIPKPIPKAGAANVPAQPVPEPMDLNGGNQPLHP